MEIDVWSDVVCPWCYIGRRRLQHALAERPDLNVVVRHRAFQLQPDAPRNLVVSTAEHLASKYGLGGEEVKAMQENVTAIARSVGLDYHLEHTQTGNTEDAHRLLLWADGVGSQDDLLERMYAAYFTEGKSLFTSPELRELVVDVGLDPVEAEKVLGSERYRDDVRKDSALAQQLGATGVPFFVFDGQYGIAGAQPLEVFRTTLETAAPAR